MNKARAMLDALMGPGRNTLEKGSKKEKFKDSSVCKSYLVGFCPLDPGMLGGKRKFEPCQRIHSDMMKEQLAAHPEAEKFRRDYEILHLRDLEYVVRECDGHIANERQRIREDTRKRKAPLPVDVNARLSAMKREAETLQAQAKALDDDRLREKESLEARAKEILADREGYMESETKKACDAVVPEEVCEICGTAYEGPEEKENHLKFKVHVAYEKVRSAITDLGKICEETERLRKQERDEQLKRKRKEEWETAAKEMGGEPREKEKGEPREREKGRSKERDRDKSRDRGRDREKELSKDRGRSRDRGREKGRDKGRSDGGRRKDGAKGKGASRERSRGRRRSRSRSRSGSRGGGRRGKKDRRRSWSR